MSSVVIRDCRLISLSLAREREREMPSAHTHTHKKETFIGSYKELLNTNQVMHVAVYCSDLEASGSV